VLNFINPTRSFDKKNNYVRFWGCDGAMEVACFLEASALQLINPDVEQTESGFLKEFDKSINRIHEAAQKAYSRSARGVYVCTITSRNF
jgi:hypothetical protein